MTVIVNVSPVWIRGKPTVSPNERVEVLPPRILTRVRNASAKCARFCAELPGPHIDPYEQVLMENLVEVRELLRHRRPLPEHRFIATRPDGTLKACQGAVWFMYFDAAEDLARLARGSGVFVQGSSWRYLVGYTLMVAGPDWSGQ